MIGTELGSYRIQSELGSGGMGTVYLARNGRQVALKVLHPHFLESPEAVERFKREAEDLTAVHASTALQDVRHAIERGRDPHT